MLQLSIYLAESLAPFEIIAQVLRLVKDTALRRIIDLPLTFGH